MAAIRGKNTTPELALRLPLHALGYRYRIHRRDLPGCPDLVFPSRRKAVFVHGCYWHRHEGCHWCSVPKSKREFWLPKLDGNAARDLRNIAALEQGGWKVAVVWECALRPAWHEQTVATVAAWLDAGTENYETDVLRPRGKEGR